MRIHSSIIFVVLVAATSFVRAETLLVRVEGRATAAQFVAAAAALRALPGANDVFVRPQRRRLLIDVSSAAGPAENDVMTALADSGLTAVHVERRAQSFDALKARLKRPRHIKR